MFLNGNNFYAIKEVLFRRKLESLKDGKDWKLGQIGNNFQ